MSRWKYKTAVVTVGDNTQEVRQLTAGERITFSQSSKQIEDGKMEARDLPNMVARFGCINPALTAEDVADMPSDLLDACVSKIMELTGLKNGEPSEAEQPEKKA